MVSIDHILSELVSVTEMIWEAAVRAQVLTIPEIPQQRAQGETLGACVHILGGWHGSVSIECEKALAEEMARKMFELGEASIPPEDWHSVLKELTNITGGNIKGLLGAGCILSTPRAWEGKDFLFSVPDSSELLKQDFTILGMYFRVRIHESSLDLAGLTQE
jgi:chemotaxis protein CheX